MKEKNPDNPVKNTQKFECLILSKVWGNLIKINKFIFYLQFACMVFFQELKQKLIFYKEKACVYYR